MKDVLEENVHHKYYLSDKMLNYLTNNSEKMSESGNGFKFSPTNGNCVSKSITTKAGQRMDDNFIKVKSATKQGFEIAEEGDSINFSQPNSETRRGRVGKEVAQTLDTACNQGVLIGVIRGRGEDNTQTLELNGFETSNSITTVQKDNVVVRSGTWRTHKDGNCPTIPARAREDGSGQPVIKEEWIKGGLQKNQPEQKNGISPCLTSAMGMGGGHTPIHNYDYRIRRLTPRECFRLMDFPDDFVMPCSDTQMYKQAGNSIVVNVLAQIINKLKL